MSAGQIFSVRAKDGTLLAYFKDCGTIPMPFVSKFCDMVTIAWGITEGEIETDVHAFELVPLVHAKDMGVIEIDDIGAIHTWES